MSETNQGVNGKVFISYSRKDKDFVHRLNDALDNAGVQAWVDWEGIELASDWMERIKSAIQSSDALLYVISPDSLKSKVCSDELELGLQLNKKLIPVLYREPDTASTMHEKLAATNWVYLRKDDNFDETIPKLVESINTDLEWVRQHTRLLERSIEWEKKNKNTSSLLLGTDLDEAEHWMSESAAKPNRLVIPIQAEYIRTSRQMAVRRQRALLVGVSVALVISVILSFVAVIQADRAKQSEATAVANEHIAATQKAIAVENADIAATQKAIAEEKRIEAEEKTNLANAQRSAALAQIYQSRAGELDTSTLLAIESYQRVESFLAEDLIRIDSSLLPFPVAQMSQDGGIYNIEWSPDYEFFVTANKSDPSDDNAVNEACVRRAKDGRSIYCIQHDEDINDAIFSPDGKYLITGGADKTVHIWKATDGTSVKQFDFEDAVLDLDAYKNLLAVARDEKTLTVIDLDILELPSAVRNFDRNIGAGTVRFSPNGNYLAFGTKSGKVIFWRVGQNSKLFYDGPAHANSNYAVLAFSNNSSWLLTGGGDSIARLTKTDGTPEETIPHGDWVEDVVFSPDDSWFVTVSDDNKVRVIDTTTGDELFRMSHAGFVQRAEVSIDGHWIATTGYDQVVRIWDSASGNQMLEFPMDSNGSAIAFNRDASHIIAADEDGNISIWDISSLSNLIANIKFPEFLHEARFTPSGESLIVNSDDYKIWSIPAEDITQIKDGTKGRVIFYAKNLTYNTATSPDSNWVAAVEYDSANPQNNRGILVSLDGKRKFELKHGGEVTGIAFDKDSQFVATSGVNSLISFWDVNSGEKKFDLNNSEKIYSLASSPVSTLFAAGLHDKIKIWDSATQEQVAELVQQGDITTIVFSQDGTWFATGSSEGNVILWKVEGNTFTSPGEPLQLNGEPQILAFSPDNHWLAGGGSSGFSFLWDTATVQEMNRIPHNDPVTSVSFSPDGTLLLTVSRKVVRIWDMASLPLVPKDKLIPSACSHLTFNLSNDNWTAIFGNEEYRLLCPGLLEEK